jgi:hypothetical protein
MPAGLARAVLLVAGEFLPGEVSPLRLEDRHLRRLDAGADRLGVDFLDLPAQLAVLGEDGLVLGGLVVRRVLGCFTTFLIPLTV